MTALVERGPSDAAQASTNAASAFPSGVPSAQRGRPVDRAKSGLSRIHWMSSRAREGARRIRLRDVPTGGRRPDSGVPAVCDSSGGNSSSDNPDSSASCRRISAPRIGAAMVARSGRAAATSAARPSALIGGWRDESSVNRNSDSGIAVSIARSNPVLPCLRM